MIECGKLAELRTYRPCEIIYAVDRGNSSSVHFILSGDCAIFQCLRVININGLLDTCVFAYEINSGFIFVNYVRVGETAIPFDKIKMQTKLKSISQKFVSWKLEH